MNIKEKLAILTAVQAMVAQTTGKVNTTNEQYAAIGKLIEREFPQSDVPGKVDGEFVITIWEDLVDRLQDELVGVSA